MCWGKLTGYCHFWHDFFEGSDSDGPASFFPVLWWCCYVVFLPIRFLLKILLVKGLAVVFKNKYKSHFFDLVMSFGRSLQANEYRTNLFWVLLWWKRLRIYVHSVCLFNLCTQSGAIYFTNHSCWCSQSSNNGISILFIFLGVLLTESFNLKQTC